MKVQVRIENLYYLLCYAWNHLEARDLVAVDSVVGSSPEALFARVLSAAARTLLRQRLDRGYVDMVEVTPTPRGRIDLAASLGRGLLHRGFAQCTHDDLTDDVLHNRIIKATGRRLAGVYGLDPALRAELLDVMKQMPLVTDVILSSQDFRRVQLHSNVRRYQFALHVCELVFRCTLLDERTGRWRFHSFADDEREMGRCFEAFVREFLRREQSVFPDVRRRHVPWMLKGDDHSLLPTMSTDIILRRPGQAVVIETKCYAQPLESHHGGHPALRSKDVYQILSYVLNLGGRDGMSVEGVLLYAVDRDVVPDSTFRLLGYPIRVIGLNLDRPWHEIDSTLKALVARLAGEAENQPASDLPGCL